MNESPFTVIYDGLCPICVREINFLRGRDSSGKLKFQDLHDSKFSAATIGKTFDDLMAQIHGVYADGRVVTGVQVFREAYKRVGLGWLLTPTGWPVFKIFFDFAYRVFARNRLRISRLFGRPESADDCERCKHFRPD